ncbi:hypothetical protein [Granulicella arctica]|uniref:DUF1571 domain-containing protein n=1 Tax=Granulicella arctica TaxID=940613 RepID=A0A7Y9TGK6_9BACT|nr:hypothetical protein [Granulicella arctica]NYF78865.1 hypothetical protein [Granulicella arctica]
MKHLLLTATIAATLLLSNSAHAQASDIPSAAPTPTAGATPEQRGHLLLDQMVAALGGPLWLNRSTIYEEGHTAAFFRGSPNGSVADFWSYRQFPINGKPDVERIEYTKKRDVVHIWTTDTGIEITYKGRTTLPKEQVDDHIRRHNHSIEEVVRTWLKQPDVVVLAEGTSMVERRMVDKVTVLSANNDAVTLELDINTHLPLRRTFEWRNETFKDHDEDAEEYDDYHTIQGFPTPFTITRYHNGDMASQLFVKKVEYGTSMPPELFDPSRPVKKGK